MLRLSKRLLRKETSSFGNLFQAPVRPENEGTVFKNRPEPAKTQTKIKFEDTGRSSSGRPGVTSFSNVLLQDNSGRNLNGFQQSYRSDFEDSRPRGRPVYEERRPRPNFDLRHDRRPQNRERQEIMAQLKKKYSKGGRQKYRMKNHKSF